MAKDQIPIGEADFWWMRHGLGIALPAALILWGLYSIISQQSYMISIRPIALIPVQGEQAVLMGIASLGGALACFFSCYGQYHEKMGWYYQWPATVGMLIMASGILWCGALHIFF